MRHRLRPLLFVAGALLSAPAMADSGITGSGTVTFEFLSASGPMATIPLSALGNTPYVNQGRFNGDLAEMDGNYDPVGPDGSPVFASGFYNFGPGVSDVEFRYDWVEPSSSFANKLVFTPASFSNVKPGELFLLGTITYTNGFWHGGGQTPAFNRPTVFEFELTTYSPETVAFNQMVRASIVNVNNSLTYGPGDPFPPTDLAVQNAEADWIYLEGYEELGSFRVYDLCCGPVGYGNTGTVELWGAFGSLRLLELRNPRGGFLTRTILPLDPLDPNPVRPGPPLSGGGGGGGGPAPIPEPATWAMLIAGFGLTGSALRRRRLTAGVPRPGLSRRAASSALLPAPSLHT